MKKEYVIICVDVLSNSNSFLFWKPEGKGYTEDINKAGIWNKIPEKNRDLVIEKKKLLEKFPPRTIIGSSLFQVLDLKSPGFFLEENSSNCLKKKED